MARPTSEGFPRPLTYALVYDFHQLHMSAVDFNLFKAIIGAIDLYEMNKFMDSYKKQQAAARARK